MGFLNLLFGGNSNGGAEAGNEPERTFRGLSEDDLSNLARDSYRGIDASINDDGDVVYRYKSASGKTINQARYTSNEDGELIGYVGNGPYLSAGSPREFMDRLTDAINSDENNDF